MVDAGTVGNNRGLGLRLLVRLLLRLLLLAQLVGMKI